MQKLIACLLLPCTAGAYFYFNWQYFSFIKKQDRLPVFRVWFVLLCFAANYLFFLLCSALELHLILNWFLFAVLLYLETLIYGRGQGRRALFSALIGVLCGLAVNVFCRSILAIILNCPLQTFDNHVHSTENLKGIPVFLGFLLAGAVMQKLCGPKRLRNIRLILSHPQHQRFLLELMVGLFFYLALNLLLYSAPYNDLFLKLWSLKSCLFCMIGFYIGIRYTRRICELTDYREKNRRIERELAARRQEEELLRQEALRDALTGLYNRQHAEEAIAAMMKKGIPFTLCFLDLDGLKEVNDRFGHEAGDRFLLAAAEQLRFACRRDEDLLARYGGDEFLLMFVRMSARAVADRAEQIRRELLEIGREERFPFVPSFSFGIAESGAFSDAETLIQEADLRMYAQKQEKRRGRSE